MGRGQGQLAKGYKLHALWANRPMSETFEVQSLNLSEQHVTTSLIGQARGTGYILADSQYNNSSLFDLAAMRQHQLVAPRQKPGTDLGHHYNSPHRRRCMDMLEPSPGHPCWFGRGLFAQRRQIERQFGNWVSFEAGLIGLPPFVRRLGRVRLWIHAKLLINAARIRVKRRDGA